MSMNQDNNKRGITLEKTSTKKTGKILTKTKEVVNDYIEADIFTKLSILIFGISNIRRKQIVKGLMLLLLEVSLIIYFVKTGISDLIGLKSLGTSLQQIVINPTTQIPEMIPGDNSMKMLLYGVIAIFALLFFILVWIISVKSALKVEQAQKEDKKINAFNDDIKALFDHRIHKLLLSLPILGLVAFTVIPLVYMILIAFTNYDANHQPPGNLFTWIGLENFKTIFNSGSALGNTFWSIFGWTMIWAVFSTFTCYFGGMFLAILINKKGIRFKSSWRIIFILTVAIPSFVSLMVIRTMLQPSGIVNVLLKDYGFITESLPFFTNATWARISVIVVNMWIGIPFSMLITTGILMNIPKELYESAKLDGAGPRHIFRYITLPFMFFVTTPYLITNFIQNINNFNSIYFLTGGGPNSLDYFKGAGKTDLLVTWLYKLTVESYDYNLAATIGIIIFVISATISLLIFRKTSAYKNDQGFQ